MSFFTNVQNKISRATEWALQACNLEEVVQAEEIDTPNDYLCPISQNMMRDPVQVYHTQTVAEFIRNAWRLIPLVNYLAQPVARHLFDRQNIEEYLRQKNAASDTTPPCPLCRREISTHLISAQDLKIKIDAFLENQPALRDLLTATTASDFDAIIQARGLQPFITKKTKQLREGNIPSGTRHVYTGSGINRLVRQGDLPQPTNPFPFFHNIQQFRFCIEEEINQGSDTTTVVRKRTEKHLLPINPMLIEREVRQLFKNAVNSNSHFLFSYIASVLIPTLIVWRTQPNFSNAFSNIISGSPYAILITVITTIAFKKLYPDYEGELLPLILLSGIAAFEAYQMSPLVTTIAVIGSYVRLLGFALGLPAEAAIALARREPAQPRVLELAEPVGVGA